MKRRHLLLILPLWPAALVAQTGHRIEVHIDGYDQPELQLAYPYGEQTLVKAEATADADGAFVFAGDEALTPGVYMLVLAPDNDYLTILVTAKEQRFVVHTDRADLTGAATFEHAPENERYHRHIAYTERLQPLAKRLREQIDEAAEHPEQQQQLRSGLRALHDEVRATERQLVEQAPQSLLALLVRSSWPIEPPEFEGDQEAVARQQWTYIREHYFDHLDLADPRLLRTPRFFPAITRYVDELTVQEPAAIIAAVDLVLTRAKPAPDSFRYLLAHFLNRYEEHKFVGMDAVFVHLVQTWVGQEHAPWVGDEDRRKAQQIAARLAPTLIGRRAPDITLHPRKGDDFRLYDVDAEFTVLLFWRATPTYAKVIPIVKQFDQDFRERGVQLVSVCTDQDVLRQAMGWDFVDEHDLSWIHATSVDVPRTYWIRKVPAVYVLDRNKTIVLKEFELAEIGEFMRRILEQAKQEKDARGKE